MKFEIIDTSAIRRPAAPPEWLKVSEAVASIPCGQTGRFTGLTMQDVTWIVTICKARAGIEVALGWSDGDGEMITEPPQRMPYDAALVTRLA